MGKIYEVWDIEEGCQIPPEMVMIDGKGDVYTRDKPGSEWIKEVIPVLIFLDVRGRG